MKKFLGLIVIVAVLFSFGMLAGGEGYFATPDNIQCGGVSPHIDVAVNEAEKPTQTPEFVTYSTVCNAVDLSTVQNRYMAVTGNVFGFMVLAPDLCQVYNHPADCQCGGAESLRGHLQTVANHKLDKPKTNRGPSGLYIRTFFILPTIANNGRNNTLTNLSKSTGRWPGRALLCRWRPEVATGTSRGALL